MMVAELKFIIEKWCKDKFDVGQNGIKQSITIHAYIDLVNLVCNFSCR